jgi:hypothetical protein
MKINNFTKFDKHFSSYVRTYVHEILDDAEIPHFIHHITDNSVFLYLGYISDQAVAEHLLMSHPFAKHSEYGIDSDHDAWIEIFF